MGRGDVIVFHKIAVERGEGFRLTLTSNEISCSAAISACEKGKQWEEALRLLQQLICSARIPNEIRYSAAISACENGAVLNLEIH